MHNRKPQLCREGISGLWATITTTVVVLVSVFAGMGAAQAATPSVPGYAWSPTANTTSNGTTSVGWTAGKAQGSGLWGYVGDVKSSTGTDRNVFTYGLAFSPKTGNMVVTDSAKVGYDRFSVAFCSLLGGTLITPTACLFGKSKLMSFALNSSPDWSAGQYSGNGEYTSAVAPGDNAGIGVNFATRTDAKVTYGTGAAAGDFGGVRGVTVAKDGKIWVSDPDFGVSTGDQADKRAIRTFDSELNEATPSLGDATLPWPQRYKNGYFDYPVGIAQLQNGNIITMSQTAQLLKEYQQDGTFVRNIFLKQPANTAYSGDLGYRSPYAITVDPADGSVLVGYIDPGKNNSSLIERIDLSDCSSATNYDTCKVKNTIGVGKLATGNGDAGTSAGTTFAIAVDPVTENIYVAQRTGQMYAFQKNGTYLGRVASFGSGTEDGQVTLVRGIAFDQRGYMYVTTSQGTSNTRIEIFARTANAVGGLEQKCSDDTSVKLAWDSPSNYDDTVKAGNSTSGTNGIVPVKDYLVEYSADGGATWTVDAHSPSTATSRVITGLDSSKTYQFRVSAWNEAGNGDASTITGIHPLICKSGFSITKALDGDGASQVPNSSKYEFEYSVDGGENWATLDDVAAGGSVHAKDLPIGTVVQVREKNPAAAPNDEYSFGGVIFSGDGVTTASPGIGEFTIGSTDEVNVKATNLYTNNTAAFTVSKAVDGSSRVPADTKYKFEYSADDGESWKALDSLKAGQSSESVSLPVGTKVLVRERGVADGSTYAFDKVTFAGDRVSTNDGSASFVIKKDTATVVAATNHFKDLDGSVKITKKLVDDGRLAPADAVFSGGWNYPAAADGSYPAGSGTWKAVAGASDLIGHIPAGASVTVTENDPAAVADATWSSEIPSPVKAAADHVSDVVVTNTLKKNTVTTTPTPTPTPTPSPTPSNVPSDTPSPSASASSSAVVPTHADGGNKDLASTGQSSGLVFAGAAGVLAVVVGLLSLMAAKRRRR